MNTAPRAIHHLNCGTMCPRGARLIAGEGGLLAEARLICHCLLIEGAEGLVLIDTGFGLDDARNPGQLGAPFRALTRPRLQAAETAIYQIRGLGLEPSDVRHVVTGTSTSITRAACRTFQTPRSICLAASSRAR